MFGKQDTVPAESSIISKLLEANNKATGTKFTHLYVKTNCKQNVHAFCHKKKSCILAVTLSNIILRKKICNVLLDEAALSFCFLFTAVADALQMLCTFGCVHVSIDCVMLVLHLLMTRSSLMA